MAVDKNSKGTGSSARGDRSKWEREMDDFLAVLRDAYGDLIPADDASHGNTEAGALLMLSKKTKNLAKLLEPRVWAQTGKGTRLIGPLTSVALGRRPGRKPKFCLVWYEYREEELEQLVPAILKGFGVCWLVVLQDPVALTTTYFVRIRDAEKVTDVAPRVASLVADTEVSISSRLEPGLAQERVDIVFLVDSGEGTEVPPEVWQNVRFELSRAQEEGIIPAFYDVRLVSWPLMRTDKKGSISTDRRLLLSHHYIPIREFLFSQLTNSARRKRMGRGPSIDDILKALRLASSILEFVVDDKGIPGDSDDILSLWTRRVSSALRFEHSKEREQAFRHLAGRFGIRLSAEKRRNRRSVPALRGILEVRSGARLFGMTCPGGEAGLPLAPFTVVAGSNRSGKSTIVESIVMGLSGKEFKYDEEFPAMPPIARSLDAGTIDTFQECTKPGHQPIYLLEGTMVVRDSNSVLQPRPEALPDVRADKPDSFRIQTRLLTNGEWLEQEPLFASLTSTVSRSVFTNDWVTELTKTTWDKEALLLLAQEREDVVQGMHDMYRWLLAMWADPVRRRAYQETYVGLLRTAAWRRTIQWLYQLLGNDSPTTSRAGRSRKAGMSDGGAPFEGILGRLAKTMVADLLLSIAGTAENRRATLEDLDLEKDNELHMFLQKLESELIKDEGFSDFLGQLKKAQSVDEFCNIVASSVRSSLAHMHIVHALVFVVAKALWDAASGKPSRLHRKLLAGILGLLPDEEWQAVLESYAPRETFGFKEKPETLLSIAGGFFGVESAKNRRGPKRKVLRLARDDLRPDSSNPGVQGLPAAQRHLSSALPYLFDPLIDFMDLLKAVAGDRKNEDLVKLWGDVFTAVRPFLWTFERHDIERVLTPSGPARYHLVPNSEKQEDMPMLDVFNYGDRLTVVLSLIVTVWLQGVFDESSVLVVDDVFSGMDQKQTVHAGLFLYHLRRIVDAYLKAFVMRNGMRNGSESSFGKPACLPSMAQVILATINLNEMLFLRRLVSLPAEWRYRNEMFPSGEGQPGGDDAGLYPFGIVRTAQGPNTRGSQWPSRQRGRPGPFREWLCYWDRCRWSNGCAGSEKGHWSPWKNDFGLHLLPPGFETGHKGLTDFYGGQWMFPIDPLMSIDLIRRLVRRKLV